ncbi:MAG: ArsA family ATPase [Candidatus Binatia bacterium]
MPPELSTIHPAISFLLDKRVLFFVGKGGVGKTTVAASVALAFARQGKKILFIEFDENTRASRLLGPTLKTSPQQEPQLVSPSLFVLSTSGALALEEYLRLIIPVSPLWRAIVESRAYQYFVAAAPGLKELLTMGKVWYEERKKETHTQQLVWDMLIIDLPATGHSLQYLRMPHAAHATFGGIVGHEAERILALLRNTQKTAINLVTTTDELAVSETLEAHRQIVLDLQLPLGTLFINRMHSALPSSLDLSRIEISSRASTNERQVAEQILKYGRHEEAFASAQVERLQALSGLPLPAFHLPFCDTEEFDVSTLQRLSYVISPESRIEKSRQNRAEQPRRGKKTATQRA